MQATVGKVSKKRKEAAFGLGWQLFPRTSTYGCCRETKFAAFHTGKPINNFALDGEGEISNYLHIILI